jgi:sulfur carrier protein ThiS
MVINMDSSKISIKLSFTGVIDIKNASNDSVLQIDTDTTIGDVLSILGIRREHKKYIISMVNDKKQKTIYILQDNDHLSLFLPVGGG